MAGTELFMAAQPGLFRMMNSLASDKAEKLGLQAGASYGKSIADAEKTRLEMDQMREEAGRKKTGLNLHLAGKYGVDPRLVGAMAEGQDYSGMSGGIDPKVLQNIQRDIGAGQIGFEKVHPYHTAVAELPGKEAGSTAATMALDAIKSNKATPEMLNKLGNVRTGAQIHQPNELSIYNALKGMSAAEQKTLMGVVGAMRPQLPYSGDPTSGIVDRGSGRIVSPPQPKPVEPPKSIGELAARRVWEQRGGAQAAPAAAPAAPAQAPAAGQGNGMPAGSKLGEKTEKGREVFDANGKLIGYMR